MGIQINIGDHISPKAGFITVPNNHRTAFNWARTKAKHIARSFRNVDPYYQGLPGGKTLTQLLNDNTIWINYHATSGSFGITNFAGGKEIAICNPAIRIGRWTILATLVHELAHVNGVRGATSPQAAERAVYECGLGSRVEFNSGVDDPTTPFDPTISG